MKAKEKAKAICDSLEVLLEACESIRQESECQYRCPMAHLCLYDTPVMEIADLLSTETAEEMLKVADL